MQLWKPCLKLKKEVGIIDILKAAKRLYFILTK
jgi:hypothetical protein